MHGAEHVGIFFMGALPIDGKPIKLNGAFHTLCGTLRFVVASAAEAELGALFLNFQVGIIFQTTLEDLGHPQSKIPVHCDNATAVGIANNTIKWQRSRAMEMRYFWTCEKDAQKEYSFKWHPGWKTLQIIKVNITWGLIIQQSGHIIYTRKIPPWNFHVQYGQAL
jgi:hypothetical protein